MKSKENLVFLGMMGSGKSSIGSLISKRLGKEFFDIDQCIENELDMKISKIFREKGEKFFRMEEKNEVLKLLKKIGIIENDIERFLDSSINKSKQPIIIFGGNWCPDCRILEGTLAMPTIKKFLQQYYRIIHIDIGRYDVVLSCLLIRNGRIVGEVKNNFEPMNVEDYENYLPQIIINLFEKNMPSNEVLVSHEFPLSEIIQNKLENKWNKKITLINPKRGWKKDLLNTAINDAKELRRVADLKRRSDLEFRSLSLEQLQHKLNLKKIPYRIEAYDISNLGDKFRVGSMVVMEDGIPKPSMYRKFHIKSFKGQDDFRSMEEIIFRRVKRLINNEEKDQSFRRNPDLILIDGGKGQLSSAVKSLDILGLRGKISILGIAKRLEEIYFPNDSIPLYLDKKSESLKILQRARDEAHRFGIIFHRQKRSKSSLTSKLDVIPGIGPATREKLLSSLKSFKRIKSASKREVINILGKEKGAKIYEALQKN